jgi:hypothetical protein
MFRTQKLATLGLALLMLSALAPLVIAQTMTPGVTVSDQAIQDNTVTIASVVSSGPGWLVVHADANGAPGPVLGYAAVVDGENANVVVTLAAEGRTDTLYAMLHTDAGTVGTYEFPGADVPVSGDMQVVSPAFQVTSAAAAQEPTPEATLAATAEATATVTAEATEQPTTLPATGGVGIAWPGILLAVAGGLILAGGFALARRSR